MVFAIMEIICPPQKKTNQKTKKNLAYIFMTCEIFYVTHTVFVGFFQNTNRTFF